MRTRHECFEILRSMRNEGVSDEKLKVDEIIVEKNKSVLVRNCILHNIGTGYLPLHSYQIWLNKDDFLNQNHGECGKITCISMAIEEEEEAIKEFERSVQFIR